MESSYQLQDLYVQKFFSYLAVLFLPVSLAALFWVQNITFNNWLGLAPGSYIVRFSWATFALGLIIYGPALLFTKWSKYLYLLLASILVSVVFISQFLYFQYSDSFLQVSALKYITQVHSVEGTIAILLSFNLLIFITNIVFVVVAFILAYKNNYNEIILSHWEKILLLFLIIVAAFFGYNYLLQKEKMEWGTTSRLYSDVYDLNTLVKKIGIINFSIEDTVKYVLRSNLVTAQDNSFLQLFGTALAKEEKTQAQPKKSLDAGIAKGRNVIFIQIESLENAVINQRINDQEITPNLNQLAKEGMYFSNYYTQVGPGNTADAEFSTLDSLYPLSDDVVFVDYAQNTYNALPQLLVSHGYSTYALHGDVPTFWNRSNIYQNLGYQKQYSEDDYAKSRSIGKGPSDLGDEDFLLQSLPKMETFKQPFMATLITMSSHTPFELPEDLETLDLTGATNLNYTQQQYLQSIHYMDMALGEFINDLKKTNIYNNSIIAIYGDHESFTNISMALGTGDSNLPALQNSQVPLILLAPGTNVVGENTTPSSHLDLFPTIANLIGVQAPKDVLGQDILNTKTPVVTRRNLFSGTVNTILTNSLAFKAAEDGDFNHGECLKIPQESSLPVVACKALYDQQTQTVKASDIIVRGNLLTTFLASLNR
jgi:lipoteichoic acid synthase